MNKTNRIIAKKSVQSVMNELQLLKELKNKYKIYVILVLLSICRLHFRIEIIYI